MHRGWSARHWAAHLRSAAEAGRPGNREVPRVRSPVLRQRRSAALPRARHSRWRPGPAGRAGQAAAPSPLRAGRCRPAARPLARPALRPAASVRRWRSRWRKGSVPARQPLRRGQQNLLPRAWRTRGCRTIRCAPAPKQPRRPARTRPAARSAQSARTAKSCDRPANVHPVSERCGFRPLRPVLRPRGFRLPCEDVRSDHPLLTAD